jgi:phosphohistidine swiveling domain-containing protein
VESGFHRSLNHSFRLLGFPRFDGKWFGMYGHYIYGNQNAVELYGRRAPFAVRSLDELRALVPRLRRDFASFPKGSVLVARTTNPAWTPLFYSAVAVITESGGPLSHGAVTAREMGIPAVMSVRGCLGKLANGQRVRVDGSAGKVWLLE